MTAPPTPAGWYPEPDGSGGQRYWDGSAWTELRKPGAETVPEPSEAPTPEHVGAHRAAEADGSRKLLTYYGAACAGLLAVLILAVCYGVFVNDTDDAIQIGAAPTSVAQTAAPSATEDSGWVSPGETVTPSPSPIADAGAIVDGPLAFTVHGTEVGPTVVSQDAPIEKSAQGEYVVVHLTVMNTGGVPATFVGTYQKLWAAGTPYAIDDEATFYIGGGLAELPPGGQADVSVAFDVPVGTAAEAIELHADPVSPGIQVPLA